MLVKILRKFLTGFLKDCTRGSEKNVLRLAQETGSAGVDGEKQERARPTCSTLHEREVTLNKNGF